MTDEEREAGCYYDQQGNFQLPRHYETVVLNDEQFKAWVDELEELYGVNNTGNGTNKGSS